MQRDIIDLAKITLRTAGDEDQALAYAVKKAALRSYVEPIWGWNEEFQIEFHGKDWSQRRPEIIQLSGRDIGTMEVSRSEKEIHLGEFYLFPDFQKHGIGSRLMTRLVEEADRKAIPVRLQVIKTNPVQSLYRRFGFVISGETRTHYLMERKPR